MRLINFPFSSYKTVQFIIVIEQSFTESVMLQKKQKTKKKIQVQENIYLKKLERIYTIGKHVKSICG